MTEASSTYYDDVERLYRLGTIGGAGDGELLERYLATRSASAFEAIVRRHGPMVLAACRRVLGNRDDADDAFQATFLVLARKAGTVDPRDAVGRWLYGVAVRTAMKVRAAVVRRRSRETSLAVFPEPCVVDRSSLDVLEILDRELARLPEKYRTPIVLHHLEGKACKDAARQLGWREGTFTGRLSRGRALLADRLSKRGLTIAVGSISIAFAPEAGAAARTGFFAATAELACVFTAGGVAAETVSAASVALAANLLRTSIMTKFQTIAAAAFVAVAVGLFAGPPLVFGQRPDEGKAIAGSTPGRLAEGERSNYTFHLVGGGENQLTFRVKGVGNGDDLSGIVLDVAPDLFGAINGVEHARLTPDAEAKWLLGDLTLWIDQSGVDPATGKTKTGSLGVVTRIESRPRRIDVFGRATANGMTRASQAVAGRAVVAPAAAPKSEDVGFDVSAKPTEPLNRPRDDDRQADVEFDWSMKPTGRPKHSARFEVPEAFIEDVDDARQTIDVRIGPDPATKQDVSAMDRRGLPFRKFASDPRMLMKGLPVALAQKVEERKTDDETRLVLVQPYFSSLVGGGRVSLTLEMVEGRLRLVEFRTISPKPKPLGP